MADITKGGAESLCSPDPSPSHLVGGLVNGENIGAVDLVGIRPDGQLWRYTTACLAGPCGFSAGPGYAGQPGAYVVGFQRFNYSAGTLTPGQPLYASLATPGAIADAVPGSGFTGMVAFAYDANCIQEKL